ncbi:hypothetical protein J6590_015015 [Homalodisca vitripennis]|nr:hypothetical protein J6590_015015 [Homalodisca vitripennis]
MSPSSFFPPPHTLEGDASLSPSVSLDLKGWSHHQTKGFVLMRMLERNCGMNRVAQCACGNSRRLLTATSGA